jgi:hypothetical protein
MNALALWIPGTLLQIVGIVLLVLGRIDFAVGIGLVAAGTAVETIGVLLWVRQRRSAQSR